MRQRRFVTAAIACALLLGLVARGGFLLWTEPWEPHHPDEHILAPEAIALWEGITPREVGWPGSTTRLVLSVAAAGQWTMERGRAAWDARDRPGQALRTITDWIGQRHVAPAPLYRLGRIVSFVTGTLQLIALAWILRGWTGPIGVAAGVLAAALSPMAVLHSQYVLADIAGLLFATLAVGRAWSPTRGRLLAMSICAGLAASSKLHFGLWIITPLMLAWLSSSLGMRTRVALTVISLVAFSWVIVTLVPWAVINPLLTLKEFVGVVAVKVGAPPTAGRIASTLGLLFGSEGALIWVGALLACLSIRKDDARRLAPIVVPVLAGTLMLARSAIVFDRYALVLLPGLAVLAAQGWERGLLAVARSRRLATAGMLVVATGSTVMSLANAERRAGEADLDVLTRNWVLAHVPRGKRVAMHQETNATLPRTAEQLRECASAVATDALYQEKWHTLGMVAPPGGVQPMKLVMLNDELTAAYWCQRELEVQTDAGYTVVRYHKEARSRTALEGDVLREFGADADDGANRVDVLIVNRPVDVGRSPVQVFETRRGMRFIYQR